MASSPVGQLVSSEPTVLQISASHTLTCNYSFENGDFAVYSPRSTDWRMSIEGTGPTRVRDGGHGGCDPGQGHRGYVRPRWT